MQGSVSDVSVFLPVKLDNRTDKWVKKGIVTWRWKDLHTFSYFSYSLQLVYMFNKAEILKHSSVFCKWNDLLSRLTERRFGWQSAGCWWALETSPCQCKAPHNCFSIRAWYAVYKEKGHGIIFLMDAALTASMQHSDASCSEKNPTRIMLNCRVGPT